MIFTIRLQNDRNVEFQLDTRQRILYIIDPIPDISIEQLLLELKDKNYILISDDDFENLKKIDSKIDILKVINKHKNDVGVNPHSLNPTYLKITEAEAKLQTKNND